MQALPTGSGGVKLYFSIKDLVLIDLKYHVRTLAWQHKTADGASGCRGGTDGPFHGGIGPFASFPT